MGNDMASNSHSHGILEACRTYGIQIGDEHLGPYEVDKVVRHPTKPHLSLLIKEVHFNSKELQTHMKRVIEKRSELKHEHLVDVIGVMDLTGGEWCSQFSVLRIFVQTYSVNLHNKLIHKPVNPHVLQRSSSSRLLSEAETLAIVLGVCKAQLVLQEKTGMMLYDIRPETLLFDENFCLKLLDQANLHSQPNTSYNRCVKNMKQFAPLSPEQFRLLEVHGTVDKTNQEKSAVFSLGIVLLSAIYSSDFEAFYNRSSFKVDADLISLRLHALPQAGYSRFMQGCLGNMLNISPLNRPTFEELQEFITKHHRPQSSDSLQQSSAQ